MIVFQEEGDFKAGALILVDKPYKWTSFDVVNKIRWNLKHKCGNIKVGHAGTLDPLATGLVVVCTGKWTKKLEDYMGQQKEYIAELCFGATTPSYDLETPIDQEYPFEHITQESFETVLKQFTGEILQVPPIFSAIRVDGKRAYKDARRGNKPEMEARKIYVKEIEILRFEPPLVELRIVCSKGTYIRSLANDIGKVCQSGAHLSALRRTRSGDFSIEKANNLEDIVAFLQDKC